MKPNAKKIWRILGQDWVILYLWRNTINRHVAELSFGMPRGTDDNEMLGGRVFAGAEELFCSEDGCKLVQES